MTTFDENSTTEDVIAGIDLTAKTVVVTGSSAGLGVETCRTLAAAGARVLMVARDVEKLNVAAESIRAQHPEAKLEVVKMDLADFDSVREAAAQILAAEDKIDLLINNAGVMACPYGETKNGLEMQFGTNHIGHFLFTCLLVPAIVRAAPARIVNLSSNGHKGGEVELDDLNFKRRPYDKWHAYGQAKTANIQFTVSLSERLLAKGVRVFALHPGVIQTELGRHLAPEDIEILMARSNTSMDALVFKTVPGGAATSVWAATSGELEQHSGIYLEDCQIAQPAQEGGQGGYMAYAVDPDKAESLWRKSEEIVGEKFSF